MQLNLRTMLGIMVATSAMMALTIVAPDEASASVLFVAHVTLLGGLLSMVVYDQGYGRALSIGGLAWYAQESMFAMGFGYTQNPLNYLIHMDPSTNNIVWNVGTPDYSEALILLRIWMVGVSGLIAVLVRRACLGSAARNTPADQERRPVEPLPSWLLLLIIYLLLILALLVYLETIRRLGMPAPTAQPASGGSGGFF